jgi:hypothetical protein
MIGTESRNKRAPKVSAVLEKAIYQARQGKLTLNLDSEGLVLALLEELSETRSTVEEEAGRGVEVGSELGEGGDITVLGKVKLERSSDGLHDLFQEERRAR